MEHRNKGYRKHSTSREYFTYEDRKIPLPTPEDLEVEGNAFRLCKVFEKDGIWQFKNYRGDEYCREYRDAPIWYFLTDFLKYEKLNDRAKEILEDVYGGYVSYPFDDYSGHRQVGQHSIYTTKQLRIGHMVSSSIEEPSSHNFQKPGEICQSTNVTTKLVGSSSEQSSIPAGVHCKQPEKQKVKNSRAETLDPKNPSQSNSFSRRSALRSSDKKSITNLPGILDVWIDTFDTPSVHKRNSTKQDVQAQQRSETIDGNSLQTRKITDSKVADTNLAKPKEINLDKRDHDELFPSIKSLPRSSIPCEGGFLEARIKQIGEENKSVVEVGQHDNRTGLTTPSPILDALRIPSTYQLKSMTNVAFQKERLLVKSQGWNKERNLRSSSATANKQQFAKMCRLHHLDIPSAEQGVGINDTCIRGDGNRFPNTSVYENQVPGVKMQANDDPHYNKSKSESSSPSKQNFQFGKKTNEDQNQLQQNSETHTDMNKETPTNILKPQTIIIQNELEVSDEVPVNDYSADVSPYDHAIGNDGNTSLRFDEIDPSCPRIRTDPAATARNFDSLKKRRVKSALTSGSSEGSENEFDQKIKCISNSHLIGDNVPPGLHECKGQNDFINSKSAPTINYYLKDHPENSTVSCGISESVENDQKITKFIESDRTPFGSTICQDQVKVEPREIQQHNDGLLVLEGTKCKAFTPEDHLLSSHSGHSDFKGTESDNYVPNSEGKTCTNTTILETAGRQSDSTTNLPFQKEKLLYSCEAENTDRPVHSSSINMDKQPSLMSHRPRHLGFNFGRSVSETNDTGIGDQNCSPNESKSLDLSVKANKVRDVKITHTPTPHSNELHHESSALKEHDRQFHSKADDYKHDDIIGSKCCSFNIQPQQAELNQNSKTPTDMVNTTPASLSIPEEKTTKGYLDLSSKVDHSVDTRPDSSSSDENESSGDLVEQPFGSCKNVLAVKTTREPVVTRFIISLKKTREKTAVSHDAPEGTENGNVHEAKNSYYPDTTNDTAQPCLGLSNDSSDKTSNKPELTVEYKSMKEHAKEKPEPCGELNHESRKPCYPDPRPPNLPDCQEPEESPHIDASILPLDGTKFTAVTRPEKENQHPQIYPSHDDSKKTDRGNHDLNIKDNTYASTTSGTSANTSPRSPSTEKHLLEETALNLHRQGEPSNSVDDPPDFSNVSFLPLSPGGVPSSQSQHFSEAESSLNIDVVADSPVARKYDEKRENESSSGRTFADVTKNSMAINLEKNLPQGANNLHPEEYQDTRKSLRQQQEHIKTQKKKVWEALVSNAKAEAKKNKHVLEQIPFDFNLKRTSIEKIWKLATVLFDKQMQRKREFEELRLHKSNSARMILVRGGSRFGKTTFLVMLAYQWACDSVYPSPALSSFMLCVFFDLNRFDLQEIELSEAILNELTLMAKCSNELWLEEVLTEHASEIVFLFDGYDELPKSAKKTVKQFFDEPKLFKSIKMIVSVSPESSEQIGYLFHQFTDISSVQTMKAVRNVQTRSQELSNPSKMTRERILTELPPYFIYFICELVERDRASTYFYDLFSLFDRSLELITRFREHQKFHKYEEKRFYHFENVFNRLGKLMFLALIQRRRTFEEDLLKSQIGSDFETLVKWNILHRASAAETWSITCKFLMVFFATKYLKYEWENQKSSLKRKEFLTNVFCWKGCNGDYVVSKEDKPFLYFVGLIPEIVLKLGHSTLENATFEMHYDVQGVELSNAFDTVNLLARVNERFLPRFAFKNRDNDDPDLNKKFEDVLCNLTINNCYVDWCFYENVFERTTFLQAVAQDNDTNDIILFTVFRNNVHGVANKVLIDFTVSRKNDVWDFTMAVLSHCLEGFALNVSSFHSDHDFLLHLILAILESQLRQTVIVSCVDQFTELSVQYRNNMKFIIFHNPRTKEINVKYSVPKQVSGLFVYDSECKSKVCFKMTKEKIKPNIYNCLICMKDPKVTVQIL